MSFHNQADQLVDTQELLIVRLAAPGCTVFAQGAEVIFGDGYKGIGQTPVHSTNVKKGQSQDN